jgi:hypothetical protein
MTTQFAALAVGTSTITAGVPGGFSAPAHNANSVVADVVATTVLPTSATVGQNLETTVRINLGGVAPPAGLTFTVVSSDPTKMVLSATAGTAGSASIDVPVQGGRSSSQSFYVHGLASAGSVSYTATATGFGFGTGEVTLAPSGIVIAGPFGSGNPIITTPAGGPQNLTVSSVVLDGGGNVLATQQVSGAVSVTVTSSDPAVGTISDSPVVIAAASTSVTTQFLPASNGTTSISVNVPAGFAVPAQFGSVFASISTPGIGLTDGSSIGQNLQIGGTVVLGQAAPAGGLDVTLTSNNPGELLLSTTPTGAGTASITITIPAGSISGTYYLQAAAASGTPTYTGTAPGYSSRTASVVLTPSGVVIVGSGGPGLPFMIVPLAGGPAPVFVTMAQLDPISHGYLCSQQLAGGRTASVTLNNTSPGIGTVPSPALFNGGSEATVVLFTPIALGLTSLQVVTPPGYTAATNNASLTVLVN